MKSRSTSLVRNTACIEDMRNAYEVLEENLKEQGHFEDATVEEKIIFG
jgi:hypothetical protein